MSHQVSSINDMDTIQEYNNVIKHCQDLFIKKTKDYGTAWRIMRLSSITDQIYIKAQRIRTLEIKKGFQSWRRHCRRIYRYYQLLCHGHDSD
ncbi:Domain of Uncharacterised Function (DUF1599) [Sphingobacterium multivorum]|uniref:Domain of Uncharacterized Function (DUF1599) n=1 Tax=Sphingobacterium multivorum TaxID=28454 RepID=A0A2X2IRM1_SPHMU|nr:Domain of Uncharacterised Function (DUF1599) [Sphingobacterium multivorum]